MVSIKVWSYLLPDHIQAGMDLGPPPPNTILSIFVKFSKDFSNFFKILSNFFKIFPIFSSRPPPPHKKNPGSTAGLNILFFAKMLLVLNCLPIVISLKLSDVNYLLI